jgi:hypothetical protein
MNGKAGSGNRRRRFSGLFGADRFRLRRGFGPCGRAGRKIHGCTYIGRQPGMPFS